MRPPVLERGARELDMPPRLPALIARDSTTPMIAGSMYMRDSGLSDSSHLSYQVFFLRFLRFAPFVDLASDP